MASERIHARLASLKNELQSGVARHQQLIAQANDVHATVQRIQGAITVLQEILSSADEPTAATEGAP